MLQKPSVIARLMGMEDAPSPATTLLLIKPPASNSNTPRTEDPRSRRHGNGDRYWSASHHCLSKAKIKKLLPLRHHRRRHPQEELLRKIRDDFHAWQRKSTSKPLLLEEGDRRPAKSSVRGKLGPDHGRYDIQMIARENLRREKMAKYGYGGRTETAQVEEADPFIPVKNASPPAERHVDSQVSAANSEPEDGEVMPEKLLSGGAPSTTRIAILRPTDIQHGHAVFGTTSKAKRDVGMEEFLQEVKERLKREMTVAIGPGSDDGTKPQQQHTAGRRAMARQIRESIMAKVGVGKRLYARSESFRVFRDDRKRAAAATAKSPEHRMLKSVIVPPRIGTLSSPKRTRKGLMECLSGRTGLNYRHSYTGTGVAAAEASPRVLVRSFSAPASSAISQALIEDTCCEGAEVTRRSSSFSFLRGTVPLPSLGGKLLMMMHSTNPQQSSNGRAESSPKCSSELDARTSDESSSCCKSSAAAEDPDTVYAGEVIVDAAGPCDGWSSSDDMSIARTDSLVLLPIIGDDVFDESCYYYDDKNAGEEEDDDSKEHRHRHRRMLSDLGNEAAVGSSRASMRRWDGGGGVLSPSEVQATTGNAASTVDDVVELEVMKSPWLAAAQLQEGVNGVVGKMERAILGELVGQVARELFVGGLN